MKIPHLALTLAVTAAFFIQRLRFHMTYHLGWYATLHHTVVMFSASWLLYWLCLVPLKHSVWRKLFSFNVLKTPLAVLSIAVLSLWLATEDQTVTILNFQWTWSAMFLYLAFFTVLLFLYERRGVDFMHGFALSFYSIMFASVLYELPHHLEAGNWDFYLPQARFIFPAFMLPILLSRWRFKRSKHLAIAILLLVLGWLTWLIPWSVQTAYPYTPFGLYWIKRLSVFPLFLLLPLGLPKKG